MISGPVRYDPNQDAWKDVFQVPARVAGPAPSAQPTQPLQTLFEELKAVFEDVRGQGISVDNSQPADSFQCMNAKVQDLLGKYCREGNSDWHRYAKFNNTHYIRHLVDECQDFELLLICWKPGQGSHIHDHGDSHCWLTCLDGVLEERLYEDGEGGTPVKGKTSIGSELPGVERVTSPCPALHNGALALLGPGDIAYASDTIALHAVSCPAATPAPGAVSLHLYAPPIRRVRLFEPGEDRVVVRRPGFWSVRGVRT